MVCLTNGQKKLIKFLLPGSSTYPTLSEDIFLFSAETNTLTLKYENKERVKESVRGEQTFMHVFNIPTTKKERKKHRSPAW